MEITVTTTPEEMMDRLVWDRYCDLRRISVWVVNEGQMDGDEKITLTLEEAREIGLVMQQGEI